MTLSDLERLSSRYYALFHTNATSFGANCVKFTQAINPYYQRHNCRRRPASLLFATCGLCGTTWPTLSLCGIATILCESYVSDIESRRRSRPYSMMRHSTWCLLSSTRS